jgi:Peptidase M60, enhancin and enhancin-like/N-terminal domain of M60-like peptidases
MLLSLLLSCTPDAPSKITDPSREEDSSCPEGSTWQGEGCVVDDPCATDNGGCGDPTVWTCSSAEGVPECDFDCSVDYKTLGSGVGSIDLGGSYPSQLIVHGDSACPLLVDAPGRSFGAFARYGSGKVLHVGHEGLLAAGKGDSERLMLNALSWGGEQPRVGIEAGLSTSLLENNGYSFRTATVADLADLDVWITTSYAEHSAEDYAAIRAWVAAGGTLIQGGHAWYWAYDHDQVADTYMGNQVLNDMGITVTESYNIEQAPVTMGDSPSELLHAGRALDHIQAYLEGTEELSRSDKLLAVQTVQDAVIYLSLHFSWFDRVRALPADIEPVIPTEANPLVPSRLPIEALVVSIQAKLAAELPAAEVEAVPSDFPGEVDPAAPRVDRSVTILADYAGRDSNYSYSNAGEPVWRGTGLYVPPGEVVQVELPTEWVGKGLTALIGVHTDTLWHLDSWERHPQLTRSYDLDSAQVDIASGFGGPLYIRIPAGTQLGEGEVQISGAVEMARYVHGRSDPLRWEEEVAASGAPMVELESDRFVLTIPKDELAPGAPDVLMELWNDVLDADATLAGLDPQRVRAERMAGDQQISAGWMHSGYPVMTYDYGSTLSDGALLREVGDWGAFHELGHNHQYGAMNLPGTTECTVNLYSVYAMEQVVGMPRSQAHPALSPESRAATIQSYLDGGRNFSADWNVWTCLETYLEYQEAFGWEPLIALNQRYLEMSDPPSSDQDKIDRWVMESSLEVGQNLIPFYDAWGFPISASTRSALVDLPTWDSHPLAGR